MIALVRKNLACLISKHNSFVCKSRHVSFSLSLQFFSTWRERQLFDGYKVYDLLLHKHQFSPQVASLAASYLAEFRKPEKADPILSFLKDSGFSTTQLERIVKYKPRILTASVEGIKFKIKIFEELGLSSEDIAKVISSNPVILQLSTQNNIIPSLSLLRGLLGSNYDVARLLRKSGRFLPADLERILLPNVEFLKSCGISMERIRVFIYTYPRSLLIKPDILRNSAEKAQEMGCRQSSRMFLYAVRMIASTTQGTWEVKLQAFRDLGFSDSDILTMFRKAPLVFGGSMEKIKKAKELLLATGKVDMSSIVNNPASLGYSIDQRLRPRLQILGILESRKLIKKWPGLSAIFTLSDDKFFEKFIRPYSDEVGKAYVTKSYINSKELLKAPVRSASP